MSCSSQWFQILARCFTSALIRQISSNMFLLVAISLAVNISLLPPVYAATGVDWLASQSQANGSISNASDVSTAYQATAEVLQTYAALGETTQPDIPAAVQYIDSDIFQSTEYLSRRIIIDVQQGSDVSILVSQLKSYQNINGGFGEFPGYDVSVIDTAFALQTLVAAGEKMGASAWSSINYLVNNQAADSAWSDGANTSSVYTTALAMQALLPFRGDYQIAWDAVNAAENFLLAQQNADLLWGESFVSAHVLLALIPNTSDQTLLAGSVAALQALQSVDGSWMGDVYQTALALQALALAANPPADPTLSNIMGSVIDAETGLALSGVTVDLTGPATFTGTTDTGGAFSFANATPGNYSLTINYLDYASVTATFTALAGQSINIGSIPLTRSSTATTGIVRGIVTDAESGLPIEGVGITVTGVTGAIVTDVNGAYQVANVPPSAVTIQATKIGYSIASATTAITAGGIAIFSPALTTTSDASQSQVKGTIVDGATGLPLSGVVITISGPSTVSAITDAAGSYLIAGLNVGQTNIDVSLAGYDSVLGVADIFGGSTVDFSPQLYPSGTTPPNANTMGLTGVVMDSATNTVLSGVTIQATFGGATIALTTGVDGRFGLNGLADARGRLAFSLADYNSVDMGVVLTPLSMLDLGQVRMRPSQVAELLPDLMVSKIDMVNVPNAPTTLEVSGTLAVEIQNQGTAATLIPTDVIAFYDADKNNQYDLNIDSLLGSSASISVLNSSAIETIQITLNGQLPFRDAPISVQVDSVNGIIENNENNNLLSSSGLCMQPPLVGDFDPVVKWSWSGSPTIATHNQVMSTPIVVPLEDTNGDGLVNENDVPGVVFNTYSSRYFRANGVLRAVSGIDGRELWTVTDPLYRTNPSGNIAAADIDGDGLVEIIALRNGGGFIAFEHDGQPKWISSPTSLNANMGGPTIADINSDGVPEIVVGDHVYNADGVLQWEGGGYKGGNANAPLSIVADINLDGIPEIVAGAAVYSNTGQILWQNTTVGDGFSAVGNFNNDDNAEIVVVSNGVVSLLDHLGGIIWGPVAIPGGGAGGAPTIADVDGDGKPEIGVAGGNNYVVFETDGSVLWTSPTRDISSSRTGSSVFDFDGDGKVEIVYADELAFRIYNGADGTILFETPNGSGTLTELPVIVDLDKDGHAEIVVATNNYAYGSTTGIRVFEDRNDTWVNTRSIWNQHTYHIDNINDDGTVPINEQPGWLTHNTYRLNTFPDRDPLGQADLTASLLQVIDNGTGQPVSLNVRIGNAGAAPSANNVTVSFYEGDPAVTGILLSSTTLTPLAAGDFIDVQVNGITAFAGAQDVFAVVDSVGIVDECNELNNSVSTPVNLSTLGSLAVATDRSVYAPNNPIVLTADISNIGTLSGFYTLDLSIEDINGATVQTFTPQTLNNIIVGGGTQVQQNWNTVNTLAGVYTLRGVLRSLNNTILSEAVSIFSIQHPPALGVEVTLRASTDKPVYHTSDRVEITSLVRNQTSSTLLAQTLLRVQVFASDGTTIFSQDIPLGDLVPGALRDTLSLYGLQSTPEGTYLIQANVLSATGTLLASATNSFEVVEDLTVSLSGTVTVQSKFLNRGDAQLCTDNIANTGNKNLTTQNIQQLLVNLTTSQEISASTSVIDLQAATALTLPRTIPTNNLVAGDYACVLQAQIQNTWQTLAYDTFTVTVPPISIDTALESANGQRLLVLMDAAEACEEHDSDSDPEHSSHNDSDDEHNEEEHDGHSSDDEHDEAENDGHSSDDEHEDEHPNCTQTNDADPHGPQGAPTLTAQRNWLENQLTAQGISHTLVSDVDAFTHELRSGGYTTYALFAEHSKLDKHVQKELREAVYRGEGLLVAGAHDNRHKKLNAVLGIKIKDKLTTPTPTVVAVTGPDAYTNSNATLSLADNVSRFTLKGAEIVGLYPGLPDCEGDDDNHHEEESHADHDENNGSDGEDENDEDSHEDSHDSTSHCQTDALAITRHAYGNGRSVAISFDLLVQAAANGADPRLASLLTEALADIQSPLQSPLGDRQPYAPALIRLSLSNTGIATPGRAVMTLPLNSAVLDAGSAQAQPDGRLIWPFVLAQSESKALNLWLQLPPQAGPAHTEALIQVGIDPNWSDYASQLLTLSLATAPTLAQVADQLDLLKDQDAHYQDALEKVQAAQTYLNEGNADEALEETLEAAEALAELSTSEAAQIRIQLAQVIRSIARQL